MMQYTNLHVNAKMISQLDFYTTNVMKAVVQRISRSQLEIELKFETSRGNDKFKVRSAERIGRRGIQKIVFIGEKIDYNYSIICVFETHAWYNYLLTANEPEMIWTEVGHTIA